MLITTWIRRTRGNSTRLFTVATASLVLGACSSKASNEQTSGGSVDTATVIGGSGSITQAVGPAVQVTRTDSKSVTKALEYKLTPENFAAFLAAADSIVALEGRDTVARAYLANNLQDAGSTTADAGLLWLESNKSVNDAINSAGISTRDYFVESIAIASAARFVNDPKAAPPTPTLGENAKFLASHQADLARLQALRENKPAVTVTP